MDAFRNYLSGQADLGTDEVILAAPLALAAAAPRPRAGTGVPPPPTAPAGRTDAPPSPQTRPADNREAGDEPVPEPAGLFQMLVRSLEDSADAEKQVKARNLGIPTRIPAGRPPEVAVPAFASLAEYRDYLDRNIRGLFTGELKGFDGRLVHGTGPEFAPLALVGMEPGAADVREGLPFRGEAGTLLGKMMRAIKLDFGSLYLTLVVKTGGDGKTWTRRDLVRLLPLFQAELALAKAPTVLLLGETCAQAVLKTGKPLEELRQVPHYLDGEPGREFAVTYHPDELLGSEDLKRKAWKDLQWLQQRLQGDRAWT